MVNYMKKVTRKRLVGQCKSKNGGRLAADSGKEGVNGANKDVSLRKFERALRTYRMFVWCGAPFAPTEPIV